MSDLVEDAIEALQRLPGNMQEAAAQAILDLATEREQDVTTHPT
jgi:hypothetical protein